MKKQANYLIGQLLLLLLFVISLSGCVAPGFEPARPTGIAGSRYCYETPGEPATISQEKAIEIAREYVKPEHQSARVSAQYVLFSDDQCNQYQDPGSFTRVPAWIVTFHDLKIPAGVENAFFIENHVAVHAQTGIVVTEFRYR
jgi:hypothetical protein